MGQNSTEVAYGFGQMGSAFTDEDAAVTPPTGKVIVAITFLEETTLTALTPSTDMYVDGTTGADLSGAAAFFGSVIAVGANGGGAAEIDANTKFPAGLTIYGRWSSVDPSAASTAGGIICYFGY
tara:strand:- start:1317 stop:1688 length:372 start_codon:yes stop_codon:yes gene_type:complete